MMKLSPEEMPSPEEVQTLRALIEGGASVRLGSRIVGTLQDLTALVGTIELKDQPVTESADYSAPNNAVADSEPVNPITALCDSGYKLGVEVGVDGSQFRSVLVGPWGNEPEDKGLPAVATMLAENYDDMLAESKTLRSSVSDLTKRLNDLTTENAALAMDRANLATEKELLAAKITELEAVIAGLQAENEALKAVAETPAPTEAETPAAPPAESKKGGK